MKNRCLAVERLGIIIIANRKFKSVFFLPLPHFGASISLTACNNICSGNLKVSKVFFFRLEMAYLFPAKLHKHTSNAIASIQYNIYTQREIVCCWMKCRLNSTRNFWMQKILLKVIPLDARSLWCVGIMSASHRYRKFGKYFPYISTNDSLCMAGKSGRYILNRSCAKELVCTVCTYK